MKQQAALAAQGQGQQGQQRRGFESRPAPSPPADQQSAPTTTGAEPQPLLLAVVDVPGLLEGRPQLVAGDVVHVRLARRPHAAEYAGQLLNVDGGQVGGRGEGGGRGAAEAPGGGKRRRRKG